MMNLRALLSLPLFVLTMACHAVEVEGVRYEPTIRVADADLTLNGQGVRTRFIIKAYTIALYLPGPADSLDAAANGKGPKRIEIVPLMGFSADQFTGPLVKGMKKNLPAPDFEAMQPRIQAFVADLSKIQEVRKGSRISLEWQPGTGTRATVDGREVSRPVEGEDFYRALLSIWIGNRPTQDDLKQHLLAGGSR